MAKASEVLTRSNPAERRGESRASGKSAAQRSEQRETSGGAVAVMCCSDTVLSGVRQMHN